MNEAQRETATLLADQLERLLDAYASHNLSLLPEPEAFPDALWHTLSELGLPLSMVAESRGGAGLNWEQIEPILRISGRCPAPLPITESLIGNHLLAEAGLAEAISAPLAISDQWLSLDSAQRLDGELDYVEWLPHADYLLALAHGPTQDYLCLISREQLTSTPVLSLARTPAARVRLHQAQPTALLPVPGRLAMTGLRPFLALARAVQSAGAIQALVPLCVEYANVRKQFGKPIGKFQAVQHLIADLVSQAAAAQAAGQFGCRLADSGKSLYGAAVAKTRSGSCGSRAGEIAHQVFGAIGVTEEHCLHHYTRRLWQWRADYGSEHAWGEWLGTLALRQGGDQLWALVCEQYPD